MRTSLAPLFVLLAACEDPAPRHVAIVDDRSASLGADADRCGVLGELTTEAVSGGGFDRRSTLAIYATGDRAPAPAPLLAPRAIPLARGRMHGGDVGAEREGLAQAARDACQASSDAPRSSPIYETVRSALAALRASGCEADGTCLLYVHTDGIESEYAPLRDRIRGKKKAEAPAPLDAAGVEVVMCGRDEGHDRSVGADMRERAEAEWRAIFGAARALTFAPWCGGVDRG